VAGDRSHLHSWRIPRSPAAAGLVLIGVRVRHDLRNDGLDQLEKISPDNLLHRAAESRREVKNAPALTVKLSIEELMLLTTLASDQLFRREFIDLKIPGYKHNPRELCLGKNLVERLRLTADRARRSRYPEKTVVPPQ